MFSATSGNSGGRGSRAGRITRRAFVGAAAASSVLVLAPG